MGAMQNVLNTTEILELVLLSADVKTLLTSAQLVCKSWHELISESPSLQQHLFLQPAPDSVAKAINPLLTEKFPHWFPYSMSEGDKTLQRFMPKALYPYDLAREDRNTAYKYEGATWRRMLPQQPPIRSFNRCRFTSAMGGSSIQLASISESGILDIPKDDTLESSAKDKINSEGDPLRMETFYHLITGASGTCHSWLLVWDVEGVEDLALPDVVRRKVKGDAKQKVQYSFVRDGLILFEWRALSCTRTDPRAFSENFVMV